MSLDRLLIVYVDNDELQNPEIRAAQQHLTRMSGFRVRTENPHFLGEMINPEVEQVFTTMNHLERVKKAARMTLVTAGQEVTVTLLLEDETQDQLRHQDAIARGAVGDLHQAAHPTVDESDPKAAAVALAQSLLAQTQPSMPAGHVHPDLPVLHPILPSIDGLSLDAQLFDVATLESVSESVAMALKQRGYTTVGMLRGLTQADLEALQGVGKRIAERILDELGRSLPPAPIAAN